jgi:hypothetical protein
MSAEQIQTIKNQIARYERYLAQAVCNRNAVEIRIFSDCIGKLEGKLQGRN